jgi:CheY-like chemotaxis protein
MQGELTLESVEGQGSIFKFSVPLQAVVTAATAPLQSASPALGSTRMLRVLVAEDTPASALVMRLILERLGHTVRVAGDGQEAVQAFADECFDLVFLDIQMPVMDGLEAAREIRQLPRGNAVAIVALSALATDHDRKNAIASGFTDYLVKPIKAADVENLIARLDIQPRR